MSYVCFIKLSAILHTVPFPVSFPISAELRLVLLRGDSHSTDKSENGARCLFPLLSTIFATNIYFSLQVLWIKSKGEEKWEGCLRSWWQSRKQFWKGFKCQGDGCNLRTWIKQSLACCKEGQKLQQKSLAWEGALYFWFFIVFFFL